MRRLLIPEAGLFALVGDAGGVRCDALDAALLLLVDEARRRVSVRTSSSVTLLLEAEERVGRMPGETGWSSRCS